MISRTLHLLTGALFVLLSVAPAHADDSEIFITKGKTGDASNLMLIIDSSGSMHKTASLVPRPYNSTLTYSSSNTGCQSGRLYYRSADLLNTNVPTSCSGLTSIVVSNANCTDSNCNQCSAARTALAYGSATTADRAGYYQDRFIRWRGPSKNVRTWSPTITDGSSATSGRNLECFADAGVHGVGADAGGADKYPIAGTNNSDNPSAGRWGNSADNWWTGTDNAGTEVVLWSPNRINHARNAPTDPQSRMDVAKTAAKELLDSPELASMNVGLMRYSVNFYDSENKGDATAQGGMVLAPVAPLTDASKTAMKKLIDDIKEAGRTPLSETLYEAHQYFKGGTVDYGATSKICTDNSETIDGNALCRRTDGSTTLQSSPSVGTLVGQPTIYDSPADLACQYNYVVYLTDGLPTSDGDLDSKGASLGVRKKIEALTGFDTLELACNGDRNEAEGQCLVALSAYMNKTDLRDDVVGMQNTKTFFIGFGDDFAGTGADARNAFKFLEDAATAGGGQAFQANDLPELKGAFESILASVVKTNSTFTAPTVAVNAFNRTQTLSDLFVAVFQPSAGRHWPGNLKKYTIEDGVIKDDKGADAVNTATGFFKSDARSIWSDVDDGFTVTLGGAAQLIPDPASRKVYTYTGTNTPASPVNLTGTDYEFTETNVSTELLLGSGDPTAANLVAWAKGQDVRDLDPTNDDYEEARHVMGDPIHSQPAVVIYRGTAEAPEAVVYMPTNDGYLHAIDADTGEEKWSFIPKEVLPQLKYWYADAATDTKKYLLDGEVRVLKFDVDGDGIVESGDRVLLFFGQGRGGGTYYALDVTDEDAPKFVWSLGPSALEGVGQAWSTPTVARVSIDGATQNTQKLVLIMGGGYDAIEEKCSDYTATCNDYNASDATGNRLFMVDALKGTVLWSAGPSEGNNLTLDRMTHAIPSKVTVMDLDSDGFADRMYVGDMAAQLWRFDITNSTAANPVEADDLVTGGVIASLGAKEESPATNANTRRFFNQPDVAAVVGTGMAPYLNISIGSGHRGLPLSERTDDRLYAIRDYKPFVKMTTQDYADIITKNTLITDAALQDITEDTTPEIVSGALGWKLRLTAGEKVLGDATTFDQKIFFVTYDPAAPVQNACVANSNGTGTNRAYIVNMADGSPVRRDGQTYPDANGDGIPDDPPPEDRYDELKQGGIAAGITFLFPEPNKLVCLSGVEVLSACTKFNSRIKTFWREPSAE
jgi:type IV pilus assembly protein PilY1